MPRSNARQLLPIVLVYLPVPIIGAVLSVLWNVGATADGGPGDMFLRGTALTPPLFLPAILLAAAYGVRRDGAPARVAAGLAALVSVAFLGGSTLNLATDFEAAGDAGSPLILTIAMAAIHFVLAITVLYHAVPPLIGRTPSSTRSPAQG